MNKNNVIAFFALFLGMGSTAEAEPHLVLRAMEELRTYCATSVFSHVEYVRDWGFSPRSYQTPPFSNAVCVVSNHWREIGADWNSFATNDEVRLLLRNIVSYAGTNALVGTWSALVDLYTQKPDQRILGFIDDIHAPATGPLEDYVFLNFDIPAISNCLLRSKALYSPTNTEMHAYYDSILSGEYRKTIEDQRALEQ